MALFTNCFPSSVITLSICGLICNHVWPVPPSFLSLSPPLSSSSFQFLFFLYSFLRLPQLFALLISLAFHRTKTFPPPLPLPEPTLFMHCREHIPSSRASNMKYFSSIKLHSAIQTCGINLNKFSSLRSIVNFEFLLVIRSILGQQQRL